MLSHNVCHTAEKRDMCNHTDGPHKCVNLKKRVTGQKMTGEYIQCGYIFRKFEKI